MNLSTLLKVHANKQPDHEALVSPSVTESGMSA